MIRSAEFFSNPDNRQKCLTEVLKALPSLRGSLMLMMITSWRGAVNRIVQRAAELLQQGRSVSSLAEVVSDGLEFLTAAVAFQTVRAFGSNFNVEALLAAEADFHRFGDRQTLGAVAAACLSCIRLPNEDQLRFSLEPFITIKCLLNTQCCPSLPFVDEVLVRLTNVYELALQQKAAQPHGRDTALSLFADEVTADKYLHDALVLLSDVTKDLLLLLCEDLIGVQCGLSFAKPVVRRVLAYYLRHVAAAKDLPAGEVVPAWPAMAAYWLSREETPVLRDLGMLLHRTDLPEEKLEPLYTGEWRRLASLQHCAAEAVSTCVNHFYQQLRDVQAHAQQLVGWARGASAVLSPGPWREHLGMAALWELNEVNIAYNFCSVCPDLGALGGFQFPAEQRAMRAGVLGGLDSMCAFAGHLRAAFSPATAIAFVEDSLRLYFTGDLAAMVEEDITFLMQTASGSFQHTDWDNSYVSRSFVAELVVEMYRTLVYGQVPDRLRDLRALFLRVLGQELALLQDDVFFPAIMRALPADLQQPPLAAVPPPDVALWERRRAMAAAQTHALETAGNRLADVLYDSVLYVMQASPVLSCVCGWFCSLLYDVPYLV